MKATFKLGIPNQNTNIDLHLDPPEERTLKLTKGIKRWNLSKYCIKYSL